MRPGPKLRPEIATAVADLTARGHTAAQIAQRLGVNRSTVIRYRGLANAPDDNELTGGRWVQHRGIHRWVA